LREAEHDGKIGSDAAAHFLHQLDPEAQPAGQIAAIAVIAPVGPRPEELVDR
jgi:hypothetical protein